MTVKTLARDGELNLTTHTPDGYSRGLIIRTGDLFPLNPINNLLARSHEAASDARPFGLRFARPIQPRAGKHEGGTNDTTGDQDNNTGSGEETGGE